MFHMFSTCISMFLIQNLKNVISFQPLLMVSSVYYPPESKFEKIEALYRRARPRLRCFGWIR